MINRIFDKSVIRTIVITKELSGLYNGRHQLFDLDKLYNCPYINVVDAQYNNVVTTESRKDGSVFIKQKSVVYQIINIIAEVDMTGLTEEECNKRELAVMYWKF